MDNEQALKLKANQVMVGGVACGWNNFPIFGANHYSHARGTHIYDINGRDYIDYCMGWGSLFLGHHPEIIKQAFEKAFEIGFGFQYETNYHVKLAELITGLIPCGDKVRFANSGTEATMFAIRIARCYTGKKKIIKFEGHFHGVHDYLLYANDCSPYLGKKNELGEISPVPGSGGIPDNIDDLIIPVSFNNTESLVRIVEKHGAEVAGIIMEPICLASAVIYPEKDFLKTVRELCTQNNMVLIFDEVMSGFRGGLGGAQEYLGIMPDIATYGKILGCGLPIAAVVGNSKFMDMLEPIGKGIASGTNTGRVLNIIGSYYALSYLKNNSSIYNRLSELTTYFVKKTNELFAKYHVKGFATGYAGRIVIHFGSDKPLTNFRDAVTTWNKEYHVQCYEQAYKRGLYAFLLPLLVCPEPITITPVHTPEDLNETLNILESIVKNTPYTESR